MYVCMYVYIYVCMYVCMYVWCIFVLSKYVSIYVCMYISMYVCMYVCTYVCLVCIFHYPVEFFCIQLLKKSTTISIKTTTTTRQVRSGQARLGQVNSCQVTPFLGSKVTLVLHKLNREREKKNRREGGRM